MFINHGRKLDSRYRHSIVYTGMHGVGYLYVYQSWSRVWLQILILFTQLVLFNQLSFCILRKNGDKYKPRSLLKNLCQKCQIKPNKLNQSNLYILSFQIELSVDKTCIYLQADLLHSVKEQQEPDPGKSFNKQLIIYNFILLSFKFILKHRNYRCTVTHLLNYRLFTLIIE